MNLCNGACKGLAKLASHAHNYRQFHPGVPVDLPPVLVSRSGLHGYEETNLGQVFALSHRLVPREPESDPWILGAADTIQDRLCAGVDLGVCHVEGHAPILLRRPVWGTARILFEDFSLITL